MTALGGRDGVNDVVHGCDNANGAVTYSKENIDYLLRSASVLDDSENSMDFEGIKARSLQISAKIEADEKDLLDYSLTNNMGVEGFEAQMERTLDSMGLEQGSVVRILEPGNNDQLTPMHVAQMVAYIKKYTKEKDIEVTVQVIVMGQGGHATTGLWHQFAEVSEEGTFTGTEEAVSLSGTLQQALLQKEIGCEYNVDNFTNVPGQVQIKLERESRHTGHNMQRAKAAHNEAVGGNPTHILVASALPSSLRQGLTAAAQYSEDNQNPLATKLYESLTAIPCQRSLSALEAFNDQQIVTEMYASLAERARFFEYGFRSEDRYIPPGHLSKKEVADLENLYKVYGDLNGISIDVAKKAPMSEVMEYFISQFKAMESAIPWVKERDSQGFATQVSMRRAIMQKQDAVALKSQEPIYKGLREKYRSFSKTPKAGWKEDQHAIHGLYMSYVRVFEGNYQLGKMTRLETFANRVQVQERFLG